MNEITEYYNQNAQAVSRESLARREREALSTFRSHLTAGARVLDAGCGAGHDLRWFTAEGFAAEGIDFSDALVDVAQGTGLEARVRDLRLADFAAGTFDGIWCNRVLMHLSIEDCHRVLGIFFKALKPRGVLFVSFIEGAGSENGSGGGPGPRVFRFAHEGFLSLLRQSGFTLILKGEREEPGGEKWVGIFARRA